MTTIIDTMPNKRFVRCLLIHNFAAAFRDLATQEKSTHTSQANFSEVPQYR